ncbi:hypothetical protein T06_14172 [Trichinella sp. T6]|nr:hypothetical protein T06_14172 [Trichinella sp. T6]
MGTDWISSQIRRSVRASAGSLSLRDCAGLLSLGLVRTRLFWPKLGCNGAADSPQLSDDQLDRVTVVSIIPARSKAFVLSSVTRAEPRVLASNTLAVISSLGSGRVFFPGGAVVLSGSSGNGARRFGESERGCSDQAKPHSPRYCATNPIP